MERQFHNDDFEWFLKNNANQYRMYPSEKVWKGIYSRLHTRRRWFGISALALLLVSCGLISYLVFIDQPDKKVTSQIQNTAAQNTVASTPDVSEKQAAGLPIKSYKKPVVRFSASANPTRFAPGASKVENVNSQSESIVTSDFDIPGEKNPEKEENSGIQLLEENSKNSEIEEALTQPAITEAHPASTVATEQTEVSITQANINKAAMALASQNITIRTTKKAPRLTAQVFFTPAVSYRKLTENKSYTQNSSTPPPFSYSQLIDVNNVVKHKPAMGLEFGIESRYEFNDRISAKAGLQFNINRYDIRAYFHPTEVATIALNSGGYRPDSLTALSNYRNFDGYSTNWIENFYFQISMPVGAELILLRDKKFEWGLAGSIQPTYLIGDRAYLITSDYKNYVKVPNLMRRWNLNTGVGAFVSYSTGRIKWQVGPQVRYQHFSSFVNIYPVSENLFNVGLKVGAKINQK